MFKRKRTELPRIFVSLVDYNGQLLYFVRSKKKCLIDCVDDVIVVDDGFYIMRPDRSRLVERIVANGLKPMIIDVKYEQLIDEDVVVNDVDLSLIPSDTMSKMYPYQVDVVRRVVGEFSDRVLLCMSTGTGKSLVSSVLIAMNTCRVLVIAPSGLRDNYKFQLETWGHVDDVEIINTKKQVIGDSRVVIMSFAIAASRHDELDSVGFGMVVVDECQAFRSHSSQRSKRLVPLIRGIPKVVLLSATPMMSRSLELLSILRMLRPKVFSESTSEIYKFGNRYGDGKVDNFGHWGAKGSSNSDELSLILSKVMIRVRKEDVLKDLPDFGRHMVRLNCSVKERRTLTDGMKQLNMIMNKESETEWESQLKECRYRKKFAEILRLTCQAKVRPVDEYLRTFFETFERRVLIFVHHRVMGDAVVDTLDSLGIRHIRIDGRVLPHKRQNLVDNMLEDNDIRAAVLGIHSASEGLNFVRGDPPDDYVPIDVGIFTQLVFTPSTHFQAEGRILRIGTTTKPEYKYLILSDSIDERIWSMLNYKTNRIDDVLDGGQGSGFSIDAY